MIGTPVPTASPMSSNMIRPTRSTLAKDVIIPTINLQEAPDFSDRQQNIKSYRKEEYYGKP